ncbi:MAG: hypothetical protein U9N08_07370 [Candidatus Caldatribacteriota bacterium]|nr:hypothetical protein [Candidatus Caldatribacteriota bacterium]
MDSRFLGNDINGNGNNMKGKKNNLGKTRLSRRDAHNNRIEGKGI